MALSGKPDANLSVINYGVHRDIVILHLGLPAKSMQTAQGTIDVFNLERENAPSVGRALGQHAAMDVMTLGIWEIIGTPIEAFTGE